MRERKTVTVPASVIDDDLLTDAEFRLLMRVSLKFGTDIVRFDDSVISDLKIKKSTFYRLLSGLVKREYLQRMAGNGGYQISVSKMRPDVLKNETVHSHIPKNETGFEAFEREEERTKEEEKDNHTGIDNNNIIIIKENEKEKEMPKKEKRRSRPFQKPTVEEVAAYCRERQNTVRAEAFFDFYESKGWMVGKNPMKDWKAAVRTWEAKDRASGKTFVPPENRPPSEDDYPF